jgi:hypothetical protein
LDEFDIDAEFHLDTSFDLAWLSSNPTSFASPASNPSSTTSLPRASSQGSELPNVCGCGLPGLGQAIDFAYLGSSANSEHAGTLGTGNGHYAPYHPDDNLEYLADSSIQLQHQSVTALARQYQHRLLTSPPEYFQQPQHSLDSPAATSFDINTLAQPNANTYDNSLSTPHMLQPTGGHVPKPHCLQRVPMYDSAPGSVPGLEHYNSFQADLSDSKSNEPDTKKLRRQRNTAAARKYRQKRLDRIEELEEALRKTQTERDELKVQVAQWKGKAEVLQSLMANSEADAVERRG